MLKELKEKHDDNDSRNRESQQKDYKKKTLNWTSTAEKYNS